MAKPAEWNVRPAKTQVSLGICPVFAVRLEKVKSLATLKTHSKDWSDWVGAQADPSLLGAQVILLVFVVLRLKLSILTTKTVNTFLN